MQQLLTILFPQRNACHICECGLQMASILCPACEKEVLALRLSGRKAVSHAFRPLDGCLSVFSYKEHARLLVHALKYESDASVAEWLGEWMAAAVLSRPSFMQADGVMPVPLHPDREAKRGYNQSRLLCEVLCSAAGLSLMDGVLLRTKVTGTQVGRSRSERLHAMRGAFTVSQPALIQRKRILLVDDVLTTGATAAACAEALLDAGASSVMLLTACRVEKD